MTEPQGRLRVTAILEPRGPAGAVVLSDAQVAALGGGKTPPVRVSINGITVAARVGRMGGENLLGFSKKLRAELGVTIGQSVDALIELDASPRSVAPPPELAAAFERDPEARARYERLAPSHQKEFARWIEDAKREQTRTARVEKTLQMLYDGRSDPSTASRSSRDAHSTLAAEGEDSGT